MSRSPHIVSPTAKVVAKVNELGLTEAAKHYGMNRSNLYRWLRQQGYVAKHQYIKDGEDQNQYQCT